jgi:hypothetical protein
LIFKKKTLKLFNFLDKRRYTLSHPEREGGEGVLINKKNPYYKRSLVFSRVPSDSFPGHGMSSGCYLLIVIAQALSRGL